jgi:hypothetical protein
VRVVASVGIGGFRQQREEWKQKTAPLRVDGNGLPETNGCADFHSHRLLPQSGPRQALTALWSALVLYSITLY